MNQARLDQMQVVPVEHTGVASMLKPVVYADGQIFYCILGDPESGVIGQGDTVEAALISWDQQLQQRLAARAEDDYIVDYVTYLLQTAPKPIYLQAFYNQFRPY